MVATRVIGTEEVVDDGVTGALVRPGDPAALGAAVARLLADPALRTPTGGGRATPLRGVASPVNGWHGETAGGLRLGARRERGSRHEAAAGRLRRAPASSPGQHLQRPRRVRRRRVVAVADPERERAQQAADRYGGVPTTTGLAAPGRRGPRRRVALRAPVRPWRPGGRRGGPRGAVLRGEATGHGPGRRAARSPSGRRQRRWPRPSATTGGAWVIVQRAAELLAGPTGAAGHRLLAGPDAGRRLVGVPRALRQPGHRADHAHLRPGPPPRRRGGDRPAAERPAPDGEGDVPAAAGALLRFASGAVGSISSARVARLAAPGRAARGRRRPGPGDHRAEPDRPRAPGGHRGRRGRRPVRTRTRSAAEDREFLDVVLGRLPQARVPYEEALRSHPWPAPPTGPPGTGHRRCCRRGRVTGQRPVRSIGVLGPGPAGDFDDVEPEPGPGQAWVRTEWSGISAGTEVTLVRGTDPSTPSAGTPTCGPSASRHHGRLPDAGARLHGGRPDHRDTHGRPSPKAALVATTYGHRTGPCADPATMPVIPVPDELDPLLGIYLAQMGPICINGLLHAAAAPRGPGPPGRTPASATGPCWCWGPASSGCCPRAGRPARRRGVSSPSLARAPPVAGGPRLDTVDDDADGRPGWPPRSGGGTVPATPAPTSRCSAGATTSRSPRPSDRCDRRASWSISASTRAAPQPSGSARSSTTTACR